MPRTKQFCEKETLNKAMELFWEKGFHATSVQDLVSHLGINRASLYDTYGGKEELFKRAFDLYRNNSQAYVKSLFNEGDSIKEGFKKLFNAAIDEAVADTSKKGCFVVNVTTELVPGDEKILNTLCAHKATVEQLFFSLVVEGMEKGEIDSTMDPKTIASYLFTLYSGLRVVGKLDTHRDELKRVVAAGLLVLEQ